MPVFQEKHKFSRLNTVIVAGPCSAETEEQVYATAFALQELGIKIFRAGVWKPRSRPGRFEGHGLLALRWLAEVKKDLNLEIAVEVASPRHIEQALSYGVDYLWIGARTTVNSFLMQEMAAALKNSAVPVLVKNPVSPDLELWLGAIERLLRAEVTNLAAIHRGFTPYARGLVYRNDPCWRIPLEFRSRLPHIPMLCDISHIAGKRDLLKEVAQQALDLAYDGLMIECHIHPDAALSDSEQQLTPAALQALLESLCARSESALSDVSLIRCLEELRKHIDYLDTELILLLEKRMALAAEIGKLKKKHGVKILQLNRWLEILERARSLGLAHGLSEAFILQVFSAIHEESVRHQEQEMQAKE